MEEEKIILEDENGETLELFVLEGTRISGTDYILAADAPEGDGECYILKDISAPEEADAVYCMVEDETELMTLMGIFGELLEDVDIEL